MARRTGLPVTGQTVFVNRLEDLVSCPAIGVPSRLRVETSNFDESNELQRSEKNSKESGLVFHRNLSLWRIQRFCKHDTKIAQGREQVLGYPAHFQAIFSSELSPIRIE